jgi:hypothetical protein
MLSLGAAIAAWRLASNSFSILKDEHEVFKAELNARADFRLSIETLNKGSIIGTSQPEVQLIWKLGIKNTGDRAANDVGINFLIPEQGIRDLLWTDEAGTLWPATASDRLTTSEELPGSDGTAWPAQYLAKTVGRFTKRTNHVLFARAIIKTPGPGESRVVPVKFKVWADEMPDDVEDRSVTYEVRFDYVGIS